MFAIYGSCSRRTQKEAGTRGGQRGQDNFKLAANFGYNSRGSADPRESLRKRRISKLALNAHKVFADLGVPCPSCVLADTRKEEPGLLKKWEKRW